MYTFYDVEEVRFATYFRPSVLIQFIVAKSSCNSSPSQFYLIQAIFLEKQIPKCPTYEI